VVLTTFPAALRKGLFGARVGLAGSA
jgi:hypothetical protein